MYYFYVLYSLKDQKLYKGYSSNLAARFISHNNGGTKSTKYRRPLVMIYIEVFATKHEAMKREKESKSLEGGAHLRLKLRNLMILNEEGVLLTSSAT